MNFFTLVKHESARHVKVFERRFDVRDLGFVHFYAPALDKPPCFALGTPATPASTITSTTGVLKSASTVTLGTDSALPRKRALGLFLCFFRLFFAVNELGYLVSKTRPLPH